MSRSSLVVLAVAIVFAAIVLEDARRTRRNERHTLFWLLIAAVLVGFALWRESIDWLASAVGIYYSPAALFFAACAGLGWFAYRQSAQIAELQMQVKRLAQEVALQNVSRPNADQ